MPSFAKYLISIHSLSSHYCPNLFGIMADLAEKDAKKMGLYITGEKLKNDLYVRAALKKAAKAPVIIKLMKIFMEIDDENLVKMRIKELIEIRGKWLDSKNEIEKDANIKNDACLDYILPKMICKSEAEFIRIAEFLGSALNHLDHHWGNKLDGKKEDPLEPFKYSGLPAELQFYFDKKVYERLYNDVKEEYCKLIERWRHASKIMLSPQFTLNRPANEMELNTKSSEVKKDGNKLERLIYKSINSVFYPATKSQAQAWQIELYTNLHDVVDKFLQKNPHLQINQKEIFNGIYRANLFFIKTSELDHFMHQLALSLKNDDGDLQEKVYLSVTQILNLKQLNIPQNITTTAAIASAPLSPTSATVAVTAIATIELNSSTDNKPTHSVGAIIRANSDMTDNAKQDDFNALSPRRKQSRRFSLGPQNRIASDKVVHELTQVLKKRDTATVSNDAASPRQSADVGLPKMPEEQDKGNKTAHFSSPRK